MAELFMTGASAEEVWPLIRDHHYSRKMPSGGTAQHIFAWRTSGGLFGDFGAPLAAVVYSVPVNRAWPSDALELQRLVRSPELERPLSEFVAWTLRWLRANTATPFVLSYADLGQGHHGGIYQACGFSYVALSKGDRSFVDAQGVKIHGKAVFNRYGTRATETILAKNPDWSTVRDADKNLYVKPLRQRAGALMTRFGWTELPYPKPDFATRPADEQATSLCEPDATSGGRSTITGDAA